MTIVFVHGGVAGRRRRRADLSDAVRAGTEQKNALDAVEQSLVVLEDNPALNAGYGSVLNRDGKLELDAGIVDGSRARWAGVAAVAIRNPIRLARRVLEETPHVLVAGAGAQGLASTYGFRAMRSTTSEQRERWERARRSGKLETADYARAEHIDTVGAVALDEGNRLSAGSSTGGVFGKLPGRVGDAPVFGAGIYASEATAVVGTGVGEVFLETLACWRAGQLVESGVSPQAACEETIASLRHRGHVAGLLALDERGRVGAAYCGGSWSVEGSDGPLEARSV